MRNWLRKPYPFLFEDRATRFRIAIFVTLFVFLFLAVFRPFGINEVSNLNIYVCSFIYALTSGVGAYSVCSIVVGLFPKFANERSWNIGKEFIMMNAVLIVISFANIFVGMFIELHPSSGYPLWKQALDDLIHTYAIGIFPVMVITFTNYTVLLKRNLSHAEQHNVALKEREAEVLIQVPMVITLNSATKNNDFELDLDQLIYIMADGNYVEFHWEENGEEKREIRRNTLNNIEAQLSDYDQIFRSHRAFMINLAKIQESKGNAQGYQLKLQGTDQLIPVSRGNLSAFDERMESNVELVNHITA